MKTIRAIVVGRVQGVWYRAHTRDRAQELGVHGYVRNLPSGEVEIVAQGEDQRLDALLEWARTGPPLAEVTELRVSEVAERERYATFEVRY